MTHGRIQQLHAQRHITSAEAADLSLAFRRSSPWARVGLSVALVIHGAGVAAAGLMWWVAPPRSWANWGVLFVFSVAAACVAVVKTARLIR